MTTYHIHIEGRVQGVGFRPFIYRLAKEHQLKGRVSNTTDGVHIYVNSEENLIQTFCDQIKKRKPKGALISSLILKQAVGRSFNDFFIDEEEGEAYGRLIITPDMAPCPECLTEMESSGNRRHGYGFITCTNCGPRFSIMEALPYDRIRTSMKTFEMCETCRKEYETAADKRFYSQTNSCKHCGIKLNWIKGEEKNKDHIQNAISLLKEGRVLAVKGVGGFLLLADACNETSIGELRKRKHRPDKPFACLFPSVEMAKKVAEISEAEEHALRGEEAPIVLVKIKSKEVPQVLDQIAPGLGRIGIMLPASPLLYQLSKEFPDGLIATSGNVSGSPIIYTDEDALEGLGKIADAILSYDREIHFPQDDSVLIFEEASPQPTVIRRSRGFAPSLLASNSIETNLLSMGAEMKSTCGLTSEGQVYISQYLGDTSVYESQQTYQDVLSKMRHLLKPKFEGIAVDLHPNYHMSQIGRQMAAERNLPLFEIQHHKAHFASVLAENNLLYSDESVLGVVWDGMGYGEDGNIWGGEFFVYHSGKIHRAHHLPYYPHISGNRMSKDPRIACLAASYPNFICNKDDFSKMEWQILENNLEKPKLLTSSIGRLFDAAAAVLGRSIENTYEGESAMKLQYMAEESRMKSAGYFDVFRNNDLFARDLLKEMKMHLKDHHREDIALKFHLTLVEWIRRIAIAQGCQKLAFSGGVFQNVLLTRLIRMRLQHDFELFFHKQLSPNDENIAHGQLVLAELEKKEKSHTLKKNKRSMLCV